MMKSRWLQRLFSRRGRIAAGVLALACAPAPGQGGAAAAGQAASNAGGAAGDGELVLAMPYVVPPFVGGSKVRTPETPDTALAEELAQALNARLRAVHAVPAGARAAAPAPTAEIALAYLAPGQAAPPAHVAVPTGYVARPMAIMRSDTDIKTWEQLRGRSVCLSEGGLYAGMAATRYAAIEKIYKAPADSLIALRTGKCDAAVHDEIMLKELLKLPEWKKFSATLPPGREASSAFLVPRDDPHTLAAVKRLAAQWKSARHLAALNKERVRDIAFEVYLDQVVADCH